MSEHDVKKIFPHWDEFVSFAPKRDKDDEEILIKLKEEIYEWIYKNNRLLHEHSNLITEYDKLLTNTLSTLVCMNETNIIEGAIAGYITNPKEPNHLLLLGAIFNVIFEETEEPKKRVEGKEITK